MDRIPIEILYRIADFMRPSGIQGSCGYESGLDLLNLMKTCRGFYEALLGYWHRALFKQHGSKTCLLRAASKNSARALENIYSEASLKFPIPHYQLFICIMESIRSGQYGPFTWLLNKYNELQIKVIKIENSRILYFALTAADKRMFFDLMTEADETDIHTPQCATDHTLLTVAIKLYQTKDVIRHLLEHGFGISDEIRPKFGDKYIPRISPTGGETHLEIAFALKSMDAIEAFIEHDEQLVNQILSKDVNYLRFLGFIFKKSLLEDKSKDVFKLAVLVFDILQNENIVGNSFRKAIWGRLVLRRALAGSWWEVAQLVMPHRMITDHTSPFDSSIFTSAFFSLNNDRTDQWDLSRDPPDEDGGIATFKMLLEKGAEIDFGLIKGTTLLHTVSTVKSAQFLIDNGFDVNVRDENGWSPLHKVILSDSVYSPKKIEIARLLVNHGADINSCNNVDHETPLMTALYQSKESYIDFLLRRGANTKIADAKGKTPIAVAMEKNLRSAALLMFNEPFPATWIH